MKAAVLYGKEDLRVEDIPAPTLKPGEVRIRIEAALTCGTDLKVFRRGYHARMIKPPAVFGHELAGVISESSSSHWKIGDRVAVANSAPCGDCLYCRNQQENLCDDLLFLNGAYAESIVVPNRIVQKNLLTFKPTTAFRDAALMEPLACVVKGIEDTQVKSGQYVLVLGAGPIGLMFVALTKNLGCHVTVAGKGAARLETARRLGADNVIDVGNSDDTATAIRQKCDTVFDAVIEAVGKPNVWEASVALVRKGGTVNFFGGCASGATITLNTTQLHYSDLTLRASFHHTPLTIRRALEFIEAGVIRAADFVDRECPLSELPQLFHSMSAGNRAVKTLINVGL